MAIMTRLLLYCYSGSNLSLALATIHGHPNTSCDQGNDDSRYDLFEVFAAVFTDRSWTAAYGR